MNSQFVNLRKKFAWNSRQSGRNLPHRSASVVLDRFILGHFTFPQMGQHLIGLLT